MPQRMILTCQTQLLDLGWPCYNQKGWFLGGTAPTTAQQIALGPSTCWHWWKILQWNPLDRALSDMPQRMILTYQTQPFLTLSCCLGKNLKETDTQTMLLAKIHEARVKPSACPNHCHCPQYQTTCHPWTQHTMFDGWDAHSIGVDVILELISWLLLVKSW
jgi:hypothetical protein